MAEPESFGRQFTGFVDSVIDLHKHNSPNNELIMMEDLSFEAAEVLGVSFMRGAVSPTDSYFEGTPNGWIVGNPLGRLVVQENRPDQIFRTRLHKSGSGYLAGRQMLAVTTIRDLDDMESIKVLDWLKSPFVRPDIDDIFNVLSPDEQQKIAKSVDAAEEFDRSMGS